MRPRSKSQFADALDHNVGVAAAAAMAHVLDRDLDLPAHRFGVGAAHGIDHGRLALERHQHVARQRVPFPMPGQPQHAAAETPVARPAGHDQRIELVLAHLGAQRGIAAVVFGFGELLPHRVAVIRCVAHIGERQRLIEFSAHHVPRLRSDTRRSDLCVHVPSLRRTRYSVHPPMMTRPPAAATASLAIRILTTCSTVGFLV